MSKRHNEYECARAWATLSAAHAQITERLSTALTRSCGLSINDFELLLRLDKVPPSGVRLNDVRETIRLSQPAISRMVARLEQQGLIGRDSDPDDGRAGRVTITKAGRAALRKAIPVHAGVVRERLLDRLTPREYEQLSALLDRIIQ